MRDWEAALLIELNKVKVAGEHNFRGRSMTSILFLDRLKDVSSVGRKRCSLNLSQWMISGSTTANGAALRIESKSGWRSTKNNSFLFFSLNIIIANHFLVFISRTNSYNRYSYYNKHKEN